MPIEQWSENVILVDLADDPQFTDDIQALIEQLSDNSRSDVLLNFSGINYLNSSNIAKLLKVRKLVLANQRKLKLCGIGTHVWGVFLVTGLDRIFEFADDVPSGLAALQIEKSA
jgi:anti-anti-sigma factor